MKIGKMFRHSLMIATLVTACNSAPVGNTVWIDSTELKPTPTFDATALLSTVAKICGDWAQKYGRDIEKAAKVCVDRLGGFVKEHNRLPGPWNTSTAGVDPQFEVAVEANEVYIKAQPYLKHQRDGGNGAMTHLAGLLGERSR